MHARRLDEINRALFHLVIDAAEVFAEHADRELGEVHTRRRDLDRMTIEPLVEVHVAPPGCGHRCEQAREPDREEHGNEQRPERRTERAELRPLAEQQVAEAGAPAGRRPGRPGRGRARSAEVLTQPPDAGGRDGQFVALDARDGKLLWETNLGPSVSAGPMTYMVNGRQYVSVQCGTSLYTFALK